MENNTESTPVVKQLLLGYQKRNKHYFIIAPFKMLSIGDHVCLVNPKNRNETAKLRVICKQHDDNDSLIEPNDFSLAWFGCSYKMIVDTMKVRYPRSSLFQIWFCEVLND